MKKRTTINAIDIASRKHTRRQFLIRTSTGVAAAGAIALKTGASFGNPEVTFDHGVASGDPLNDRVIIWTRVSGSTMGAVSVSYDVAVDPYFTKIVTTGQYWAGAERDYTVKIDVDGLSPGTTYYYRFRAGGTTSITGRTKTLPTGNVSHLRYAVCTCADYAHGYFQAYARMADREDLDFVIHLGDYIYEYGNAQNNLEGNGYKVSDGGTNLDAEGGATYGNFRKFEPGSNVVSLSDYRTRYAQYHRDPDLVALRKTHPLIVMWDDHDFADNAWQGDALNHDATTQGLWETRKRNAEQAFFEWLPIREDLSKLTGKDLPQQMYRSFSIGSLADLFMLEGRVHGRSKQVDPNFPIKAFFTQTGEFANPERTILGVDAEKVFYKDLQASTAKWKLIGNGVLMTEIAISSSYDLRSEFKYYLGLTNDSWNGYDPARKRFYNAITTGSNGCGVQNVVVMSGDLHLAIASSLTENPSQWKPTPGSGCRGAEIMPPSITAPSGLFLPDEISKGVTDALVKQGGNLPLQYLQTGVHGYVVVDITPERMRSEWWYLSGEITLTHSEEYLGKAFEMKDGYNYLEEAYI